MAISTQDGTLAGARPIVTFNKVLTPTLVSGRPHSLWYLGGDPGAGTMDSATSGGVNLVSSSVVPAGALYHADPGAGNSYVSRLTGMASQPGTLFICDRLWHGSDIIGGTVISPTVTTSQAITAFPGLPSRDDNGAGLGAGVRFALEVYSAMGAGTPTINLGYTNPAGTTGRSAGLIDPVIASMPVGAFLRFGLQAGDSGIKTPTSIQLSATMTSGNFGLVAYRVLAALPLTQANVANELDALTSGFQRIYNGASIFAFFVPNTTTAAAIGGSLIETQG